MAFFCRQRQAQALTEVLGQGDRLEVPFLVWHSGLVFGLVQLVMTMLVAGKAEMGGLQRK